ncbi:MAG: hypothetical protein QOJ62_638 [Actinomycetota bacterium]|jgi:hypothetical protein|nr:hypothetical protein [Actinomycetota bacterium]
MTVALITVALGWTVALDQAVRDGFTAKGGTAWLIALAAVATAGAIVAIAARQRHAVAAIGLFLVACSPTVFAYPVNVLVLLFALAELIAAVNGALTRRLTPAG